MDIAITILQILALIGISFLAMFKKNYFPKYLEEKAKNTATKKDIEFREFREFSGQVIVIVLLAIT